LIGEGDGIPPSSGAFPGTRIQLVSGNTVSSMIQFGRVPRSLRFLQGAGALVEYDCETNISRCGR